ncbi:unnamed protein product [Amoebophrya sp. A25]|nr:unnamed protein product [Amoebophrya sp. A25]|eukprot:GSA25T00006882001.1
MRRRVPLVAAPVGVLAVTPVEKVVQLLSQMKATGIEERNSEQVEASAFAQHCVGSIQNLEEDVVETKEKIEEQEAIIAKSASTIATLEDEIAVLEEEIANDKADAKAAREVRELEKSDFQAANKDYSESLDALSRAIETLKSESVTNSAAETLFVQLKAASSMRATTTTLERFLATAPQGKAYGYQSAMGGVIDMLTELQSKFDKERQDLVSKETEAQHAYDLLAEEKATSNKNDAATIARKDAAKGKAGAKKGAAEGEKADLVADLGDTKTTLKDTKADCKLNNALYTKQDDLRAGEIDALTQAIEIMSSGTVAGAEAEHVSLSQSSFLQLGAGITSSNDAQQGETRERVMQILLQGAEKNKSRILSLVAARVEASPFKKVLKMIFDMISKLQKQSAEEAEAHGWCQGKLSSSKMELDSKNEEVEDLTGQSEALTAKIGSLTELVSKLEAEIKFLTQDRATATKTRATQKAENEKKIKESSEAEAAVANAIGILKEFYAGGAKSAAEDEGKETATEVYGGQQAQAGGVVNIMEVIEADFARVVAETTEAESSQAADYKKLMNSSEVTVAVKKTEKAHNSKLLTQAKKDSSAVGEQLKLMTEARDGAQEQHDGFKKQCSDGLSFEERMEARKAEIQSLKEALEVLKSSGV